jgi:isopropylmalate/homocitrate/citramalate synthase
MVLKKLSEEELKKIEEETGGVPDSWGRWVVSKENLKEIKKMRLPKNVIILDDTLRSGANMPYVYLKIEDKLEIAKKLEEVGVREIMAGYAGVEEHNEFIRRLKDEGTSMRLIAKTRGFIPDWKTEIDRAADCGFDGVNFLLGRIGPALGGEVMSEEKYKERVTQCVTHAKERGLFVMGPSTKEGLEAGVDRVTCGDGEGWLLPETVEANTKKTREKVGPNIEISIHCHDDFGLAAANTLAGLKGGGNALEVTVNGFGHRSGNANFEQIVLACEAIYGVQTGIKIDKLYDLCKFVEKKFGMLIGRTSPFVGQHAYCHGGLHIPPVLKDPPEWYRWEPVRAETIGASRTWMWHTPALQFDMNGPIASKIRSMGLSFNEYQMKKIIEKTTEVVKKKNFATDKEIENIIRNVISP